MIKDDEDNVVYWPWGCVVWHTAHLYHNFPVMLASLETLEKYLDFFQSNVITCFYFIY